MFPIQQVESYPIDSQESNLEQDQVRKQSNMMSSSLSFIIIAAIACLSLCYGYSNTAAAASNSRQAGYQREERQQNNSTSINLLEAMTTDLRRLQAVNDVNKRNSSSHSNFATEHQLKVNESRASGHDQILGDSSDLLSILTSANDGELLETMPESQRSDSSPLLSMQLPVGQRRFDDSTLALASTGQGWGNKYMMPKTYVSKQQMVASAALQPRHQLNSYDPYFQDSVSPTQYGYNKRPVLKERMSTVSSRPEKRKQRQQQQQTSFTPIEPRDSKSSQEEGEDPFFEEKEPVKAVDSDETVSKGFAEGDDIFKEDAQVASKSNNNRRSLEERSSLNDIEEEDDGVVGDEDEEQQNSTPIKARSSQDSSTGYNQYNDRKTARKPLRGIEDSSSSDERLESSNVKSKKSNPEVELVLRARAQSSYNKHKEESSAANFESDGDEISSGSHIDKSSTDLQAAAGHHHGHSHGHYYQYVEVPKKKAWKMGFKRGNHKHTIMRHEKGYKNKFHSSFKWNAKEKCKKKKKCHSVGKMTWHYEHHEKKKKHHY